MSEKKFSEIVGLYANSGKIMLFMHWKSGGYYNNFYSSIDSARQYLKQKALEREIDYWWILTVTEEGFVKNE